MGGRGTGRKGEHSDRKAQKTGMHDNEKQL